MNLQDIQKKEKHEKIRNIMREGYQALTEKGYNPINQLCGYLVSADPTYITNHKTISCQKRISTNSKRNRRKSKS